MPKDAKAPTGLVTPAGREDWFIISRSSAEFLKDVPGWGLDPKGFLVHRSHLALIPGAIDKIRNEPSALVRRSFDSKSQALGWSLRPHQHVEREFILGRRGTLIASTQRTGKTLSALSSHDPSTGPLLIVAPLATRPVWLHWLGRVFPGVDPVVLSGQHFDAKHVRQSQIVLVHYDIVSSWQTCREWGTCIIDEVHVCSNQKSKRTQGAMNLSLRASRVVCLSGTPLWNKPWKIHSILQIANPGAWGTLFDFAKHHTNAQLGAYGWTFKGTRNEDELQKRLSEVMIRHRWEDIADHVPDTTRSVEVVPLTAGERLELEALVEAARPYLERDHTTVGEIARLRQFLGLNKIARTVELAKQYLENGEPVVVWTWHKGVAEEIVGQLGSGDSGFYSFVVTGDYGQDTREEMLSAWREFNCPAALIITIGVGQVGIDLSHARHAIFAELSWTPAEVAQAEMRTFAVTRPMTVDYIVVDDSIEVAIIAALMRKIKDAKAIGVPAAESAIDVLEEALTLGADQPIDLSPLFGDSE